MNISSRPTYVPGELLVRLKPRTEVSLSSDNVLDQLGEVVDRYPLGGQKIAPESFGDQEILHLKLDSDTPEAMEQALQKLSRDPNVAYAVTNDIVGELVEPVVPNDLSPQQYGPLNISAPLAWAERTGDPARAPLIAVIDSGIDYNHPDLAANVWTNPNEIPGNGIDDDGNGVIDDVHGYNAFADSGDPMDGQGHGTHCAGTIAGVGNDGAGVVGVNQHANLMAVKIFNDEGSTDAAAIIRGIQYATKMGARITSNSWGGPVPNAGIKQAFEESPALHLVAAGNSGVNNDWFPSFPANYDLDNIISVAATDHNDGLASFSQYGKRTVDLGAPGVDILSTVPGGKYDVYSGTSMATPHVSGAATLIASQYPNISNEELRARLLDGADKVESLAGKTVTGGRLNVHNSLTLSSEGQA